MHIVHSLLDETAIKRNWHYHPENSYHEIIMDEEKTATDPSDSQIRVHIFHLTRSAKIQLKLLVEVDSLLEVR